MFDRLLNPNRIVKVIRKLRYPADKKTVETMKYWLAQGVVVNAPHEENTKSLRIVELDDN